MTPQLALGIQLDDRATFDNYYAASSHQLLINHLRQLPNTGGALLTANESSVGRSHLLQASCQRIIGLGLRAIYLPLSDLQVADVDVLSGLESVDLIAIDDVDCFLGNRNWEEALFHVYNRCQLHNTILLFSLKNPLSQIRFEIADLKSRLSSLMPFQVKALTDDEKVRALQLRAVNRGLNLPGEVALFMLRHCPRNMRFLSELLEKLDLQSLAEQRRLTIPFVKTVLSRIDA